MKSNKNKYFTIKLAVMRLMTLLLSIYMTSALSPKNVLAFEKKEQAAPDYYKYTDPASSDDNAPPPDTTDAPPPTATPAPVDETNVAPPADTTSAPAPAATADAPPATDDTNKAKKTQWSVLFQSGYTDESRFRQQFGNTSQLAPSSLTGELKGGNVDVKLLYNFLGDYSDFIIGGGLNYTYAQGILIENVTGTGTSSNGSPTAGASAINNIGTVYTSGSIEFTVGDRLNFSQSFTGIILGNAGYALVNALTYNTLTSTSSDSSPSSSGGSGSGSGSTTPSSTTLPAPPSISTEIPKITNHFYYGVSAGLSYDITSTLSLGCIGTYNVHFMKVDFGGDDSIYGSGTSIYFQEISADLALRWIF